MNSCLPSSISINRPWLLECMELLFRQQRQGVTCLPFQLGLSEDIRRRLLETCTVEDPLVHFLLQSPPQEDVRQELLQLRIDEWLSLRSLMLAFCKKR